MTHFTLPPPPPRPVQVPGRAPGSEGGPMNDTAVSNGGQRVVQPVAAHRNVPPPPPPPFSAPPATHLRSDLCQRTAQSTVFSSGTPGLAGFSPAPPSSAQHSHFAASAAPMPPPFADRTQSRPFGAGPPPGPPPWSQTKGFHTFEPPYPVHTLSGGPQRSMPPPPPPPIPGNGQRPISQITRSPVPSELSMTSQSSTPGAFSRPYHTNSVPVSPNMAPQTAPTAIPRTPPTQSLPPPAFGHTSPSSMSPYSLGHAHTTVPRQAVNYAQPQQQPMQQRPRLDPSQMPRPPVFTSPQEGPVPVYYPCAAVTQGLSVQLPPSADTRYVVQDDGNASPRIMRCTTYNFPRDRGLWHQTGDVPLAVMCTPLAVPSEDYVPSPRELPHNGTNEEWQDIERVPLISNACLPPRCGSCQAYVNPFFGRDGTCNLCGNKTRGMMNDVSGPALQFGTVDYEVTGPYITRSQPVQPMYLYAVDLTCPDLMEYLPILALLGQELAEQFARQPVVVTPPRIGMCLVSSFGIAIHYHANQGGYVIMGDITEEPFSPLPLENWTFELSSRESLQSWYDFLSNRLPQDLNRLKDLARGSNAQGVDGFEVSCGGATLAFLADALKESGGRGTLITWRRPNHGVGRLSYREHNVSSTVRKEEDDSPFTPLQTLPTYKTSQEREAASFYKNLGDQCVRDRISLDIVYHCDTDAATMAYFDVATLGDLCSVSCGRFVWINETDWRDWLVRELSRPLQSFSGWDVIFKARCSAGMTVKSFLCQNGIVHDGGLVGTPELELSSVSPSTTIAVELEHRIGGLPKDHKLAFLQTALLYSTHTGMRRVRVSTLAVRVSAVAKDIYTGIDLNALAATMMRQSSLRLRHAKSAEPGASLRSKVRDEVYSRTIEILSNYRKIVVGVQEQLMLPETAHLLPLFCMSFMKSHMLRPGIPTRFGGSANVTMRPTSDQRAYFVWHAAQASPSTAMLLAYPRIYNILNANGECGEWKPSEIPELLGSVSLPPTICPSMEEIQEDGVYLVDGGLKLFLHVGRDVPDPTKNAIRSLSLAEWEPTLPKLVWQLRAFNATRHGSEGDQRPTCAPLVVVWQRDGPQESIVLDLMVDDAIGGEPDYSDFLIRMHHTIRDRLQASK